MAKDLLLEIGMEEIPARFVRAAIEQLQEKTVKWLRDARIGYAAVQSFATPRRLAILVTGVDEKQADVAEEIKGPSKKIAVADNGDWSKAALGFARSQGVNPEQLFFRELAGVEYVYAAKNSLGVNTGQLLADGLLHIINSMTFPKHMRWGAYELKFVRPIRWIVTLFGNEVIPLHIAGVDAGRVSRGHRFLGGEAELRSPSDYVESLRAQYVLVDANERKQRIVSQLDQLADAQNWHIAVHDELLEEVLFLVEYPTALYGAFDPQFLNIPQEVLITSMREHQRYFPVLDDKGQLLPFFVTVRNGDERSLEQVAKGNEKVLRARLSDAKFFYEEDQKMSIDSALARLETIVFQEELGSIGDKVRRIRAIAAEIGKLLPLQANELQLIDRAAAICKFDLVTQMVYEFPELQGVMGEDYARKAGENERVAKAIFEHYQPRFSGDASPASIIGALVSIADKIDTITGCFSIGIIPTGSQDPYALRRQAAGIVQTVLDRELPLSLPQLFGAAINVHARSNILKRNTEELTKELMDFFGLRVRNMLSDNTRYDVVEAVMASGFDHLSSAVRRAAALTNAVAQPEFKAAVESFNRVVNLAGKAISTTINPADFEEKAEHDLYDTWQHIYDKYINHMKHAEEVEALSVLSSLRDPITAYFDSVMVMVDDEKLRSARLALLLRIANGIRTFADFQKLVW